MTRALTITLNPALDVSTSVDRVQPDKKLRCEEPRYDPGGGGVNVSRAMAKLGVESTAFIAIGGITGRMLLAALKHEGVETICFESEGDTRQSFAVREGSTGKQFRFVMPGPAWSPGRFASCLERLSGLIEKNVQLVVSGSFPPGLPPTAATQIMALAEMHEAPVLVDTSGPALQDLLSSKPHPTMTLVLSQGEAEAIAGCTLDQGRAAALAQRLVDEGCARSIIITLGETGAVGVRDGEACHVTPPKVSVVSKVGAGDSFVAGLVIGGEGIASFETMLVSAMAAAASAVTTPATELCEAASFHEFRELIVVRRL